jgi:hypothetical protein
MSGKPGARAKVASQALFLAVGTFTLSAAAVAGSQGAAAFRPRSCGDHYWRLSEGLPWVVVAALPWAIYALVIGFAMRRRQPPVTLGEGPYRQSVVEEPVRIDRPRLHRHVLVSFVVLALVAGIVESRRLYCPYAVPESCRPKVSRIVVMGVGSVEPGLVATLASHFRDCYGLPVTVAPPIPAPEGAWSAKREQWAAEAILDALPGCQDADPLCGERVLTIGITSDDLYATKENWRYAFTVRDSARHTAILSTSRMSGAENVRKVVAKTIALEYCGLPQIDNPRSVRHNHIMGPADLDAIEESIW